MEEEVQHEEETWSGPETTETVRASDVFGLALSAALRARLKRRKTYVYGGVLQAPVGDPASAQAALQALQEGGR